MRKKSIIINIALFIFLASIFMLFSNGRYGGDGLENYLTAESLVLDGDIAIHDRPFGVGEMRYKIRGQKDSAGRYYSEYGIGTPILLAPFYAVGHLISKVSPQIPHDYITQFCVSLANPIITALIALVLFIFMRELDFSLKTCFYTVLCYSFCTMTLIYTRSGFSEPGVTLFVLLALLFLHRYEQDGSLMHALIFGVLIGFTLLIKKNSFLYLGLVMLYLIYKSFTLRPLKQLMRLWAGMVAPITLFVLLYFYSKTGLISRMPDAAIGEVVREGAVYGNHFIKALFYYLLSPGKGFFFYNVPLLLALFGVKGLLKKNFKVSVFLLVFLAANILFYSYHFIRGSLFSWGPRYLYTAIPVMCIFFAAYAEKAKSVLKRLLLAAVLFAGFLIQLPCLFINFTKHLFFVKESLGQQEYLINFVPELSPIWGSWHLLISAVKRTFTGSSLSFTFNPDYFFIEPVTRSLKGYDIWDIWWINIYKVSPQLSPIVIVAVLVLILAAVVSFIKLNNLILRKT